MTGIKILHILPHAGGGVGAVLRAVLTADSDKECRYTHSVASLEYLNEITRKHCNRHGIDWIDEISRKRCKNLSDILKCADIVIIHWWNHPLLMNLLFEGLPSTRLIMWSHVNGYFPPQSFFPELFEFADRFVFATEISIEAPSVNKLSDHIKTKLRIIRSCSGIPSGSNIISAKSTPFKVGYIGTVEPIKMHAGFLTMCANASIPEPCLVVGGPAQENLRVQAKAMNLDHCFNILDPVKDPKPIFKKLHAFAYPLNPKHFGTGEQVLIEAMAFGAVPVVLNNPPEKAVVRHGKTGLVAESMADFSEALHMLKNNPAERDRLAAGAHSFVMDSCGIEHTIKAFHELFDEMICFPKQPHVLKLPSIDGLQQGSASHLFLASLGESDERLIFEKALQMNCASVLPDEFASKTRGTPFHYLRMLGNDPALERFCNRFIRKIN